MRNLFKAVFLAMLLVSAVTWPALAEDAEKAAAASSVVTQFVFSTGDSGANPPFVDVLSTSIKPPGGKDLFITFSAQSMVGTTSNQITTPIVATFTLENIATQVRVLLDGTPLPIAPPSTLSIVTFDNLVRQTNLIEIPPGFEILGLVVNEGGARSYSWIARNVSVGEHTITVQARFLFFNARFPLGQTFSSIFAALGPKTLTVEQVNLKD